MTLDAFDFFGGSDDEFKPSAKMELEKRLGEMPQTLSAERLLKPSALGVLKTPAIYYFFKNRAWAVELLEGKDPELSAVKLQSGLIAKRALTASDVYLHDKTLYVLYEGGALVKQPEQEQRKERGPSIADLKHRMLIRAREVFGEKAVMIKGSEADGYQMSFKPTGALARKFGSGSIYAPTLGELGVKLDAILAKVESHR